MWGSRLRVVWREGRRSQIHRISNIRDKKQNLIILVTVIVIVIVRASVMRNL